MRIACKIGETHVIFGYMVSEEGILHYAFVKEAFCNFGIAKSLFQAAGAPKFISHKTFTANAILMKHPELIYNPFVLFKGERYDGEDH